MRNKILLLLTVFIAMSLMGCPAPQILSTTPDDGATGIPLQTGQGKNLSANVIKVTFDREIHLEYDSTATISPAPVVISSTTAAHSGTLSMAVLVNDEPEAVYLFYDEDYILDNAIEYTITINNIWNRNRFLTAGNYLESDTFSFTSQ